MESVIKRGSPNFQLPEIREEITYMHIALKFITFKTNVTDISMIKLD